MRRWNLAWAEQLKQILQAEKEKQELQYQF